jgi:ribosome biogenesis protein Nip4
MKELRDFLAAIGADFLPEGEPLNLNNRRFTLSHELFEQLYAKNKLVYAGKLLGRTKREFIPSTILLRELSCLHGVNKIWVDERIGWLFTCGRDVFEESIQRIEGTFEEGTYFLVMLNLDCLGYGIVEKLAQKRILRNIFDIGDFLRRENAKSLKGETRPE